MSLSRGVLGRSGVFAAIVIIAMLASPLATLGLQDTVTADPSPAEGQAGVIAQGVATVPDQAAWQVSRDSAESLEDAVPEEQALGFVVAHQDAVLVNDLSFGTQNRLGAGEASFVAAGAVQQRVASGGSAVDYYQIGLVPADVASDAGGADMLFASDAFATPSGNRDIDLVRNVLAPDDEGDLAVGGAPALLLVIDGQITVEQNGTETLVLDAGEAGTVDGDATLDSSGAQTASYVAAVIGPAVPPIPRFTGSVSIQVESCPQGMTPQTLDASACDVIDPAAVFAINLLGADGNPVADSVASDGQLAWSGLPFGTYTIDVPQLPEDVAEFLVTDVDGVATSDLTVTIDRQSPDVARVLFTFPAETAQGTITLQVRGCPEGMTPDTLAGDFCDLAPEGYAVQVTESATGEVLTLDDGTSDGASFTFGGLQTSGDQDESGTYVVSETTLPPGYASYLIVGPAGEPSNTSVTVQLSEDQPEAQVAVYNFVAQDSVSTPGAAPTATGPVINEETPTEEATTDTGVTGSVTAQIWLCPEGSSSESYDASACSLANGNYTISLYEPDGTAQTGADAAGDANTVTWTGLAPGDYFVEITGLPSGYDVAIAADAQTASNNANAYLATVAEDDPDAALAFYLFAEP